MIDNACEDQISVLSRNMALTTSKDSKGIFDSGGKYVRYTAEQVETLERLYSECPKPSSIRRQQLIRECPILQNIEPKQIKVWFQNRRCREKQRKESSRLQSVNAKLTAMNKLLMEENDRLQKQVAQMLYENGYLRQQLQHQGGITTDTSCDSVVTSGLQHLPTPQQSPHDASNAGIFSHAEETLTEFLGKATGTAIDWIQMPGMKPGPDTTGMVNISHGCAGVAARSCGLVSLEPSRVLEIVKDRPSWQRDCRRLTNMFTISTANGGTIEVLYMQTYAPTTLAPARDFYTLRYTSLVEDGSYVICERSVVNGAHGVPIAPQMQSFVRAEMHSSGCLIRPCEGSGSIIINVDHMDLEPWTVPEVLRPFYESSAVLAHQVTMAALKHLRLVAEEAVVEAPGGGQQPAAVRTLSHRLARGFNDAVNGFADDGWTVTASDGMDDVTVVAKSHANSRELGVRSHTLDGGTLCAKASMLLQNVPPALLVRFLREHRSEWADHSSEEITRIGHFGFSGLHGAVCNSQLLEPLHAVEQDEFLELIKMESRGLAQDQHLLASRDMFLLQLCSGLEENSAGACAQMVFAPIDATISGDAPLIPSGFRAIPLDSGSLESGVCSRTLDLASTLEVGAGTGRSTNDSNGVLNIRSVLTIAFQFEYESHMQENVAAIARQYVRNVVSTVQRVAMALAPSRVSAELGPARNLSGTPESLTLARWICKSYRLSLAVDLVRVEVGSNEEYLKALWKLSDAVMCCSCKSQPVFTFANQAGLEMLETSSMALQELSWEKTLDEDSRQSLCTVFTQVMQQGYACLPAGMRLSSMGRPASYDRAIAWKVLDDEANIHGVAFVHVNWSLVNVKADHHHPLLL